MAGLTAWVGHYSLWYDLGMFGEMFWRLPQEKWSSILMSGLSQLFHCMSMKHAYWVTKRVVNVLLWTYCWPFYGEMSNKHYKSLDGEAKERNSRKLELAGLGLQNSSLSNSINIILSWAYHVLIMEKGVVECKHSWTHYMKIQLVGISSTEQPIQLIVCQYLSSQCYP